MRKGGLVVVGECRAVRTNFSFPTLPTHLHTHVRTLVAETEEAEALLGSSSTTLPCCCSSSLTLASYLAHTYRRSCGEGQGG